MRAKSLSIIRSISPRHLVSRLSVRARIIAIAVIPVIGFLANGFAFMSAASRNKLLFSLLNMRRCEAQYRQTPKKELWEAFFKEFRTFDELLRDADDAPAKEQLQQRVQAYASTLAQWNRRFENTQN